MHHNNNNIAIAEALESIASSLSKLDIENHSESIGIIESEISRLDTISKEMDAPELRALAHWTMLNIEQEPTNNDQIHELLKKGSYYHWMDILSTLLREYDQSLLPKIYTALTGPNWLIKPSAPLLRNLAGWIELSKHSIGIPEDEVLTEEVDKVTTPAQEDNDIQLSSDIETLPPNIFEEVETDILEKTYSGDSSILNDFSENIDSNLVVTDKTSNYFSEIDEENKEEELLLDNKNEEESLLELDTEEQESLLFTADEETLSDFTDEELLLQVNETTIIEEHEESSLKDSNEYLLLDIIDEEETATPASVETAESIEETNDFSENSNKDLLLDIIDKEDTATLTPVEVAENIEEANDFSDEVEDIIMTLASTSMSDNVFEETESYTAELERLTMLAEISGYSKITPISQWCQQNLTLFAKNQSDDSRTFIESGECWNWIELINIALNEPDEISHISELSTELSREEWLEPLAVEDLQELLLFIRNPDTSSESNTLLEEDNDPVLAKPEDIIIESSPKLGSGLSNEAPETTESSEFSFTWDEDTHPELLEAYFEETTGLITEASHYLQNIGSKDTTKEERQTATRTVHTIKGGSAVVGITALSEFAYKLEQIFDHSVDHELSSDANTLLNNTAQCLEDLYNTVKDKTDTPDSFTTTLSQLTVLAESFDDDDETVELSAPILPDFITQQNSNDLEDTTTIPESDKKVEKADDTSDIGIDNLVIDTSDAEEELNSANQSSDHELDEDLSDFSAELDDIVMTLMTTEVSSDESSQLDKHISELQRLDMLAEISGFPEVSKVSNWCQHNLELITQNPSDESHEFISSGESWSWIELISACLSDPDEISHISSLSTELMRDDWIEPIEIEDLQNLLLLLKATNAEEVIIEESANEKIDSKAIEAADHNEESIVNEKAKNDIKIVTWDEDVHPELLSVYLQETSEQVSKIAVLLLKISKGKADKEEQKQAARIAHTIKGASGVVGVSEIVELTHRLEDILDYSVNNKIPADTAELLAESSDCLESLFEAVQNKAAAPEEFEPVLAKLTEYASSIENEDYASSLNFEDDGFEELAKLDNSKLPDFITNEAINEKVTTNEETSSESIDEAISSEEPYSFIDNEIIDVTQKAIEASNNSSVETNTVDLTESHIRVPVTLINRLLNLAGELVTTSTQVTDKVESSLTTSSEIKDQDKRVHKMLKELSTTIYKQESDQLSMLSSLQDKQFDTLEMDTYNELHSIASLLTESILDSETIESTLNEQLHEIQDDLRRFDQLNKELSDTILNSRMESLNTLIPRLERIVRQTCRKTDKKAELIVTGNEINIDTEILNGLVDPLLHLLRNAIDHGIETPETRKAKNKDNSGKIHLSFARQGNFIHMQLKDDGAGINPENIYQHAVDKGLITPDQEYSKSEVLKLILQPGFSTHSSVTDISGRGVGMDVVNAGVKQLKGSLSIDSEVDEGTTINIRIPLTLVTSSTLLVSTANNQVAIPTDTIEQLFYLSPEDVLNRKGEQFIRYLGNELAIKSLAGILGWPLQVVDFTQAQTLLLVKGENELHAIHIDEIIHSREVVIKSLAHFIDSSKGVIGACHLTDGAVAPVINLPQLLSLDETSHHVIKENQEIDESALSNNSTPQILVVDDSLSNRKALSLIIDKTDYDVITAVDGLDALNIMNERHIDMVFTDLEMPRMTGLELTQSIRAWNDKKHIPVVMITSRSTNKHRQLAEKAGVDDYLTKPVGTDTLLESMETWLKQEALA